MKRCIIRFVILPLIVACSLIWFNCVGDQTITEPNQNQIAESKTAIAKTIPVQDTETAQFLSEVSRKVGRTLTKEEDHFLNRLFALVKKINSENPARRKATGKKYLDMTLTVCPSSGKNQRNIAFSSPEDVLSLIQNNFPLEIVSNKQPPIKYDQWIDEGDIKTGSLYDYTSILTLGGGIAASGTMTSTFWYVNGKQYAFMEQFQHSSALFISASIEEMEHSQNGSRVVWGKGVLKASIGFTYWGTDFSVETVSSTLADSFIIPTNN